jgi:hypothetical protein
MAWTRHGRGVLVGANSGGIDTNVVVGVDAPKASPDVVARIVAGIRAGVPMIWPDDASAPAGELYLTDPLRLEIPAHHIGVHYGWSRVRARPSTAVAISGGGPLGGMQYLPTLAVRTVFYRDVLKEVDNVDAPDVMSRVDSSPALRSALGMTRPPNWWGIGIDGMRLFDLSRNHGIPLAWVPRQEIIKALAAATDRAALESVLRARADDIIADCVAALDECVDDVLGEDVWLANRAIAAFCQGHHEAALALAVSLGEPLANWASIPRVRSFGSQEQRDAWPKMLQRKYTLAAVLLAQDPPDGRFGFISQIVMAPIPSFFAPFRRENGDTAPATLSRHVVAHRPTREHFSVVNSLVAIMLVTSILRQQEDWCEEVGPE